MSATLSWKDTSMVCLQEGARLFSKNSTSGFGESHWTASMCHQNFGKKWTRFCRSEKMFPRLREERWRRCCQRRDLNIGSCAGQPGWEALGINVMSPWRNGTEVKSL